MKILQVSDLHLGAAAPSLSAFSVAEINAEMWNIVLALPAIMQEKEVDILLVAGDLFDSETIAGNWHYLILNCFEKILKQGKIVVYATGNHDYFITPNDFKLLSIYNNFLLFSFDRASVKTLDYQDKTLAFYGIGYQVKQPQRCVSADFPTLVTADYHIAIAHGEIDNENTNYYNFKSSDMLKYDVFAIGHRHQFEQIVDKIFYAGSTLPINVNNIGKKGALLYDLDDLRQSLSMLKLSKFELEAVTKELTIDSGEQLLAKLLDVLEPLTKASTTAVLALTIKSAEKLDDFYIESILAEVKSKYSNIIYSSIDFKYSSVTDASVSLDIITQFSDKVLQELPNDKEFYFDKMVLSSYIENEGGKLNVQLLESVLNYEN